jgi:hypothetical protein
MASPKAPPRTSKPTRGLGDMDTNAPAADHLELLARELTGHPAVSTRIVRPTGRAPYLRVASRHDGERVEEITCDGNARTIDYLWSWGDPIAGDGLSEKAQAIIYVVTGRD